MIPQAVKTINFEVTSKPSKTYKVNFVDNQIRGFVDELDAVKQAIMFILNTERYEYEIYPWSYGIELNDLYGQHISYVYPELKRRIKEALTQDDRIESVDNFSFEKRGNQVTINFIAHTIFGDTQAQKVVEI